jgi:hypothetical protein
VFCADDDQNLLNADEIASALVPRSPISQIDLMETWPQDGLADRHQVSGLP